MKFFNHSVVNIHFPKEEKNDLGKETFYEKLEKIVQECPKKDDKRIMGNFKGKIGQGKEYIPTTGNSLQ